MTKANDQVCFSALQQWEFAQTLAPLVGSRPADYTPAVFAANPFANSIFRKVGELPAFSGEAQQVALRMGVIASVEHVLAYIEEIQEFRKSAFPSVGDDIKDDAGEEQLRLKVQKWSGAVPVAGYFRTIGYFRHLRNHYAHVREELHPSFAAYIRSHGTPLNRFWRDHPTDLHGINFSTLPATFLTPDITFGIMNVLRVSLQHVDHAVASTLDLPGLIKVILEELLRSPGNRQRPSNRIASKICSRLDMEWNVRVGLATIRREVERLTA